MYPTQGSQFPVISVQDLIALSVLTAMTWCITVTPTSYARHEPWGTTSSWVSTLMVRCRPLCLRLRPTNQACRAQGWDGVGGGQNDSCNTAWSQL